MANFKRKRAKNQRAGCLYCKPHKANGAKDKEPAALALERRLDSAEISEAKSKKAEPVED